MHKLKAIEVERLAREHQQQIGSMIIYALHISRHVQLVYLSVETSRPEQGTIQDVSSVSGSNDNDTSVALEAVHLCQQLVEGLLTLIVASTNSSSTRSAHSINLIHKDNAGCILLCLHM